MLKLASKFPFSTQWCYVEALNLILLPLLIYTLTSVHPTHGPSNQFCITYIYFSKEKQFHIQLLISGYQVNLSIQFNYSQEYTELTRNPVQLE